MNDLDVGLYELPAAACSTLNDPGVRLVLHCIRFSHYCERARWTLRLLGVPCEEVSRLLAGACATVMTHMHITQDSSKQCVPTSEDLQNARITAGIFGNADWLIANSAPTNPLMESLAVLTSACCSLLFNDDQVNYLTLLHMPGILKLQRQFKQGPGRPTASSKSPAATPCLALYDATGQHIW